MQPIIQSPLPDNRVRLEDEFLAPMRRLVRVVVAARDIFALVLVESDLPFDLRDWVVNAIRTELIEHGIDLRIIDLTREHWNILDAIDESGASTNVSGGRVALLVRGIEWTPRAPIRADQVGNSRTATFAMINLLRESLEQRVTAPVILWCRSEDLTALRREAPDFFDHFSAIVRFPSVGQPPNLKDDGFTWRGSILPRSNDAAVATDSAIGYYERRLSEKGLSDFEMIQAKLGLAEALVSLAESKHWVVPDQALKLLSEVETSSRVVSNDELLARVLQTKARIYYIEGGLRLAVDALSHAVRIHRRRNDYHQLAATLGQLGLMLRECGDLKEALRSCEESLEIYRRLAQAGSVEVRARVAATLNNLGMVLADVGNSDGAYRAYDEALSVYRRLAERYPSEFEPYVATTLNNLGVTLTDLGDLDRARRALDEALPIYHRLAAGHGKSFEAELASALNNLGIVLRAIGDGDGARRVYAEAIPIFRRLAASQPAAFESRLAAALNNFGSIASELGDHSAALQALRAALETYRRLSAIQPAAFTASLGMTLNNMGNVLRAQGQFDEARRRYQEALLIRQQLSDVDPSRFEPDVATTTYNLGAVLRALDDHGGSRRAYENAINIYRRLAATQPAAFLPKLAGALNNLGNVLVELGQREVANRFYAESLGIYEPLAERMPAAFAQHAMTARTNYERTSSS